MKKANKILSCQCLMIFRTQLGAEIQNVKYLEQELNHGIEIQMDIILHAIFKVLQKENPVGF